MYENEIREKEDRIKILRERILMAERDYSVLIELLNECEDHGKQ